MVRYVAIFAAVAGLSAASISPGFSQSLTSTRVGLDQTRIIRTQEPIGGIAVGNTEIVSVALHDLQTLILTGRSPGVTNMMVMDPSGRVLQETRLIVPASRSGGVTITRRNQTTSYVCDSASCSQRRGER